MREATNRPTPQLAAAFLALSDDGEALEPARRSALAALLMVAAIALAAPLAWVAKPSDVPLATPASKAALPAPGDDGPGS
jgi:ferric-dicitrate binding protein FerR (iron transport regulator)